MKKTGTCLLKAPNILLYYFVSIKSLLSTTLLYCQKLEIKIKIKIKIRIEIKTEMSFKLTETIILKNDGITIKPRNLKTD